MRRFLFAAFAASIASFAPAMYSREVRVKGFGKYTYDNESIFQLKVRGKYGRYLTFFGRSPVSYEGYSSPGNPGYMKCSSYMSNNHAISNCSRVGYIAPTYIAPKTIHGEWIYELDCQDRTFDRKNDRFSWLHVSNDPVAQTVANKYCSRIYRLSKMYKSKKSYYYESGDKQSQDSNKKQIEERVMTTSGKTIDQRYLPPYLEGRKKFKKQDYNGAIVAYTESLKFRPGNDSVYEYRAEAKVGIEDYEGAIEDYTKSIELDYSKRGDIFAKKYLDRGIVKYNINDLEGACSDWREASRLKNYRVRRYLKTYCKK